MSEEKKHWKTVLTPLGAKIGVGKPLDIFGHGVILLLTMQSPSDTRRAEVLLDQDAIKELIAALEAHQLP